MYAGVPELASRDSWVVPSNAWAIPKSMTSGPLLDNITFGGFRSRWIIPASWIAVSAVATARPVVAQPWSGRATRRTVLRRERVALVICP
jgi:hypothetical protein